MQHNNNNNNINNNKLILVIIFIIILNNIEGYLNLPSAASESIVACRPRPPRQAVV